MTQEDWMENTIFHAQKPIFEPTADEKEENNREESKDHMFLKTKIWSIFGEKRMI